MYYPYPTFQQPQQPQISAPAQQQQQQQVRDHPTTAGVLTELPNHIT